MTYDDLNFKYLIDKILILLGSRKFWTLLFAAAVALGLPISEELQAWIVLLAMGIFAGTTAWEDVAATRGGGDPNAAARDGREVDD